MNDLYFECTLHVWFSLCKCHVSMLCQFVTLEVGASSSSINWLADKLTNRTHSMSQLCQKEWSINFLRCYIFFQMN